MTDEQRAAERKRKALEAALRSRQDRYLGGDPRSIQAGSLLSVSDMDALDKLTFDGSVLDTRAFFASLSPEIDRGAVRDTIAAALRMRWGVAATPPNANDRTCWNVRHCCARQICKQRQALRDRVLEPKEPEIKWLSIRWPEDALDQLDEDGEVQS